MSETLEELESADSSPVASLDTLKQVIHFYSFHLNITLAFELLRKVDRQAEVSLSVACSAELVVRLHQSHLAYSAK